MTNTPPPTNDDAARNGDAAPTINAAEPDVENPVFDDVATEHPEVQDAAPDLVEPEASAEPAPLDEPTPLVEPVETNDTPIAERASAVTTPDDDVIETTGYEERIPEPVASEPVPAPVPVAPPVQTVYVSTPAQPKKKGNRGFGVLFAFLGTLVFAVLFAAVIALILLLVRPENAFGGSILGFIGSSAFWVPVAVYFIVFVLFALIVNRGGWVSWVLSSFLVAAVVYFASIGVILLLEGVFGMTPDEASQGFGQLALSAPLIVAAILAREVTIWFGAGIASRGRKVKARNLEARAAYERDLDERPLGFS